jgi:ribose 5-phosphate isomerase B
MIKMLPKTLSIDRCKILYRSLGGTESLTMAKTVIYYTTWRELLMVIAIGCDHAGVELKRQLSGLLKDEGIEVMDVGTNGTASVDYPDYGAVAAGAVSKGQVDAAVLICGTGIGMSIVANKFKGVRAALCRDVYTARMSREHNDANVLVIGSRVVMEDSAEDILRAWLHTKYEGGRHDERLKKISIIEGSIELKT